MNDILVKPVTDKGQVISSGNLNPHWTNRNFKKPQTIFLDPEFKTEIKFRHDADTVRGADYSFSDRLMQFHGSKCEEAIAKAEREARKDTADFFESYLQILMDKQNLRLIHIISGVNGRGYPYRVYGHIDE